MKVLITGFEPFKKEKVNPSWEVCRRLSDQDKDKGREGKREDEKVKIEARQLPVAFDEARKKALEFFNQVNPDIVLHLGEAGGRTHISVERIAVNCDEASIKDNKGQKRDGQPIEPDGEDGLFTTIPVKRIVKALKKAGIPAVVSNSAGTYLCNHVLYGTLHHTKDNHQVKVGFIHLPYLPEQTIDKPQKASMSLDLMVKAVKIAVKECAQ